LTAPDKKFLEQLTANVRVDPATQRGEKIARFKREKEMRNRIEVSIPLHNNERKR
jgi:hypothetical protein